MPEGNPGPPAKVLSIAGSDSGGAAGLQADLRTWAALRVYGMCAITAVTAQNSVNVKGIEFMSGEFVKAQMDAVLSDYGADAVKTGLLGRVEIVEDVSAWLHLYSLQTIVVDPVLVNYKGRAMFAPNVTQAYINHLFPLADLVTPNRREAELLTGLTIKTIAEMETAVRHLRALGPRCVLLKGGREGERMIDLFFDGRTLTHLTAPHIETANTHGSGDTLSAAACAFLAKGEEMETAVYHAHQFSQRAISQGAAWQLGAGRGPALPW